MLQYMFILARERGEVGAFRAQVFRVTRRPPPFSTVLEAKVGRDPQRRFETVLCPNKTAVESA
jgi:hypothetical protein